MNYRTDWNRAGDVIEYRDLDALQPADDDDVLVMSARIRVTAGGGVAEYEATALVTCPRDRQTTHTVTVRSKTQNALRDALTAAHRVHGHDPICDEHPNQEPTRWNFRTYFVEAPHG